MSTVVVLSGSPSPTSRTAALAGHIAARLAEHAHQIHTVQVRDLPAHALLAADPAHPAIAEVVRTVALSDALVVASPIYKAAYSGLLKALLDVLPQLALADKVVLPVVTGGTPAHVLAIDYALRPVLSSLGAAHVVPGRFVLDKHIETLADGTIRLPATELSSLHDVVDGFSATVRARRQLPVAA